MACLISVAIDQNGMTDINAIKGILKVAQIMELYTVRFLWL